MILCFFKIRFYYYIFLLLYFTYIQLTTFTTFTVAFLAQVLGSVLARCCGIGSLWRRGEQR